MELTCVLEENIIGGSEDRWQVVNHSSGITAKIIKTCMGIESATYKNYYNYMLHVTGEELEGKVVIVRSKPLWYSVWEILHVQRTPANSLAIVPLESQTASHPGATLECGWFWEGEDCIYQNVTMDGGHSLPFGLSLDQWGVPMIIEQKLTADQYWHKLQTAAGLDPYAPPAKLSGMLRQWMQEACEMLIATKMRLEELAVNQTQIGEIVKSVMGRYPQEGGSEVATLAKSSNPEIYAPGNAICRAMHEIAGIIGLPLPETDYLQPFRRPADRHRRSR